LAPGRPPASTRDAAGTRDPASSRSPASSLDPASSRDPAPTRLPAPTRDPASSRDPAPSRDRQGADWAFGAGDQAITYVSQLDSDHYVEHGLTWYASTKSLALTPGHTTPDGVRYRTFDPSAAILRCFQCHSTGPPKLGARYQIEPSEPGVRCESCHGPGQAHIQANGARDAIFNPRRLTAAGLNDFCGACHRKPPAAGGDTDWTNPWNTRHQPLYLSQSACFLQSNGKLSCLTCHLPHEPLARDAAAYGKRCAGCHPSVRHRTAVSGRACTGCHMPRVTARPELVFTNHWIGVYAKGGYLRPARR